MCRRSVSGDSPAYPANTPAVDSEMASAMATQISQAMGIPESSVPERLDELESSGGAAASPPSPPGKHMDDPRVGGAAGATGATGAAAVVTAATGAAGASGAAVVAAGAAGATGAGGAAGATGVSAAPGAAAGSGVPRC